MFSTWRPFHPSTIGGHDKITSAFSYRILVKSFPLPKPSNCKSMNDAITSILIGKLNALNSWRNFPMGSSATVLKPERVHQISYRGSIKFDAPALISILDTETYIEITNHRTAPIAQKQKPDWKETGRANDSLSQLLPGSGRQRSGLMFIEQLAYPTVTDSSSTAISWRAYRREPKDHREHSSLRSMYYYP
jgi:hypothetical protein